MSSTEYRKDEVERTGSSAAWIDCAPPISVMLPTFRRPDALERTLAALERQSLAVSEYEVIVVDDGSRDGTGSNLQDFAQTTEARFLYIMLRDNGGPARARNFGLSRCRGEVILIIGDDIEPAPDLIERHLRFHRQNPGDTHALLGHVSFPEEPRPSEFMKWLERGGRKYFFNYADLMPGQEAGPLFFYTCNVSLKRRLLEKSGWFDESFPHASHEDLELGYRLADQGMVLVYDRQAHGYHHHMLSIEGVTRRIYLMGYSAELFWRKVNDRGSVFRQAARNLLTWLSATPPGVLWWRRLRVRHYSGQEQYPLQWHILLFLSFFIGLSDAKNGRPVRM